MDNTVACSFQWLVHGAAAALAGTVAALAGLDFGVYTTASCYSGARTVAHTPFAWDESISAERYVLSARGIMVSLPAFFLVSLDVLVGLRNVATLTGARKMQFDSVIEAEGDRELSHSSWEASHFSQEEASTILRFPLPGLKMRAGPRQALLAPLLALPGFTWGVLVPFYPL